MINFNSNNFKEITIFIIVGLITVFIDYLIYIFFFNISVSILFSKSFGYISGTIFSYFANKLLTFKDNRIYSKTFFKFILLYIFTLLINTLSNNYLVTIFENNHINFMEISFLISTSISATLNFLGMKFLIFNPKS